MYLRELPGMLAAPSGTDGATLQVESERTDEQETQAPREIEIDPFALKDIATFGSFLAKVAAITPPVQLWCWDARLSRLLTLVNAGPDATTAEVDLPA